MTKTVEILEIPFTTLHETEILDWIASHLRSDDAAPALITTPNPEILLKTLADQPYRHILQHSALNLPDGNGIIWAHKFLQRTANWDSKPLIALNGIFGMIAFLFTPKNTRKRFNKAIHGSDLTIKICANQRLNKYPIFFFGNANGLASNSAMLSAQNLKKKYPEVNIVGFLDSTLDDKSAINTIINSGAEILLLGFGAPLQEKWLYENLERLKTVKIAMGVGGTFDFIAGILPRAPWLLRAIGMEWFYRLLRQPIKRLRRILNAFFVFPYYVVKKRLANPGNGRTTDI